eukprot:1153931-Pelagomonas_calceolata.AAC.7
MGMLCACRRYCCCCCCCSAAAGAEKGTGGELLATCEGICASGDSEENVGEEKGAMPLVPGGGTASGTGWRAIGAWLVLPRGEEGAVVWKDEGGVGGVVGALVRRAPGLARVRGGAAC